MSRLYATISGDGWAAARTRCANRETTATVQSLDGSIAVSLLVTATGVIRAQIHVELGRSIGTPQRCVFDGTLAELAAAGGLEVTK